MSETSTEITGRWQMVRAEHEGESAPDEVTQRTVIELTDGAYAVWFDREVVDRGTYEIGGVVDCRTIILRGTSGPNAGRTIPCVYQIRGERLRVCFGLDGIAPTDFSTKPNDRRYLATYRRACAA